MTEGNIDVAHADRIGEPLAGSSRTVPWPHMLREI
jgi:hypothetical protein